LFSFSSFVSSYCILCRRHALARRRRPQLSLVIDNLPTLSGQFQCAFSAFGKTLLTNATRTANGVSCTTPRTDHIPANPPGQRKSFLTSLLSLSLSVEFALVDVIPLMEMMDRFLVSSLDSNSYSY
jgi:hypothetical protein